MTKQLFAKNPSTGFFFNGRAFEASQTDAIPLRSGTTAESFRLVWACPVEIVEVEAFIAEKQTIEAL